MGSASDDRVAALHRELEELSRPRLAKPVAPSFRDLCEHKARLALERAVEACSSQREAARILGVNERSLRDFLDGSRRVPAWLFYALPRLAKVAYATELLREIPPEEGDEDGQRVA